VVSAAAAASSLRRVWTQMEDLGPDGCAVTHVDESDEPGVACSWLSEVGLPLRWLGTGQRVPDDLARASGENLALWLLAA
jgi:flagellar biosynthesis protein FlhF